ncbi:PREDICTED: protein sprint [Nicrophorus vespilloides]|uniref:Protein sprint n=1 Tax=Nicrophorus vespilloides TaxID=110193 RepID=A0ABM1N8K5_NICVS|nr:PREDICTED: protein sprint [Nicrophorus vespilloides]
MSSLDDKITYFNRKACPTKPAMVQPKANEQKVRPPVPLRKFKFEPTNAVKKPARCSSICVDLEVTRREIREKVRKINSLIAKDTVRSLDRKIVQPYDTTIIKWNAGYRDPVIPKTANVKRTISKVTPPQIYKRINDTNCRQRHRSDQFLEPYFQGYSDRQSPGIDAPSPIPNECSRNLFNLPNPPSRSPSRESLVSSTGGSDAGSEDSGDTGYGAACDIGMVERLRRSHPIWFLPGIQRAGAFHLLQGKEEGCFVVRQSSQTDTMALSVRLPPDKGPYIEHYLIQNSEGRLGLETSENRFEDIPALIAHYANCCDELPVQLVLPKAIRDAKSRQKLSSLALLGQEFWRYSPPPSTASSPDADLVLNLNPLMSTFKTAEPSTPVNKDLKPLRPNTLNLCNRNETGKSELKSTPSFKNDGKQPPPPPPRWSKPTTPQNNITVTTTFTFSVNQNSPKNETASDIICDPKRMSPEGQTSTMSSKGSLRRVQEQILSPSGSVLSPNSDPNSLLSPDTLSPLTKTARQSRRKHKPSKHYQESDILDSPTVYYRSTVGDKVSDYEDVWSNENSSFKSKGNFASPDLLQHVINNNNNVLSPTESFTNSSCSTPLPNNQSQTSLHQSTAQIQSPIVGEIVKTLTAEIQSSPKQGSPFYAEPADALAQVPRRLFNNRNPLSLQQRHSNPPALHSHAILSSTLDRTESSEINDISSSVDNLSPKQRLIKRPELKPVMPPSLKPRPNDWQLDNTWKFLGNECDLNMDSSDYDSDWAATIPNVPITGPFSPGDCDNRLTSIHEMISKRQSTDVSTTDDDMCRMSAYDNVDDKRMMTIPRAPPSEISELTEFSDPWNESHGVNGETDDSFSDTYHYNRQQQQQHNQTPPQRLASINRSKSFKDRLDPLLSAPRLNALRNHRDATDAKTVVGTSIRNYALNLAQDKRTTFAKNIDNFIACTHDSKETNPQVVMRNMRQFMSGMKNYLVKHGEKGFDTEVEKERTKLKSTEFLNLDAILEGVLHLLVVSPLKAHLYKLFNDYYTKTGAITLLSENIHYASTRPTSELAIKPKISLPSESALQKIKEYLSRLQSADSPLEKLEYLLAAIAAIFNSVKTTQISGASGRTVTLGADDFLPLFVWVLVKTKFVSAEIEAEYMWGLLHPSLLSGEGGYYLTTLSSAVHVLKNFKESIEENVKNNPKTDSVLKVVVPDELHGSILTKTLPARPHMTTKEVCKIIAHKARITNPQDFALYRLVDGEETMLGDNECPQDFMKEGKHVMLAYKRIDAKIAWPRQQQSN